MWNGLPGSGHGEFAPVFGFFLDTAALGVGFFQHMVQQVIGQLREVGRGVLHRPVLDGTREHFGLGRAAPLAEICFSTSEANSGSSEKMTNENMFKPLCAVVRADPSPRPNGGARISSRPW